MNVPNVPPLCIIVFPTPPISSLPLIPILEIKENNKSVSGACTCTMALVDQSWSDSSQPPRSSMRPQCQSVLRVCYQSVHL